MLTERISSYTTTKFCRRPKSHGHLPMRTLYIAVIVSLSSLRSLAFDTSLFLGSVASFSFLAGAQRSSTQKTVLNYKNLPDDQAVSKTPSRIKTNKLKSYNRKSRKKFAQNAKFPLSEAELAHDVQSYFSGDLEAMFVDSTYGVNKEICDDEITQDLNKHPALVLNADYQPLRMLPLSVWSWQSAVKAVLGGKALVVETYPDVAIRAVNMNFPVPSVIALIEYAPVGKVKPAFTRRNVFLRDGYRCQYCSGLFRTADLSLDHVEPRCFGGQLTWENTVTSCKKCNGRKGCLRLAQIHTVGMALQTKPRCPSIYELSASANKFVPRKVHPSWIPFLGIDMVDDDYDNDTIKPSNGSSLPRP